MRFRVNYKARWYILSGVLTSFLCMYLFSSFDYLGTGNFLLACATYVFGIFLLAKAPIDGMIGKWLIPAYALFWTIIDWHFLNATWKRLGNHHEGLAAAMLVAVAQVIGNGISFVPKVQRVLRYYLGFSLMLFWPWALYFLLTLK